MRIATLFSGIGAPEQAAKRVWEKHDIVFACEIDKFARQSYEANYDIDKKHFHSDITHLDATPYKGKVDLLVGGSPCQSFSIAGKRGGFKDTRGSLFFHFARILRECEPTWFVFENVKGLVSHDKGKTFETVLETFVESGYRITAKILNTKDFNIPQNRERLFIVGVRNDSIPKTKKSSQDRIDGILWGKYGAHFSEFKWPKPTGCKKRLKDVLEEEVDEKYYIKRELSIVYTDTCDNGDFIIQRSRGYNEGGIHTVCPTISSNSFQQNNILNGIRKLTPRECLRLQDFPDDFKQVVSDSQLYKQAGNSMTVKVVEKIFKRIKKHEKKTRKRSDKKS